MDTQSPQNLTQSTLSGLLWMLLGSGGESLIKLIVFMVLCRLLAPSDFGVMAAAMTIVSLSAILLQAGVGPALIQRAVLDSRHIRCAFTISISVGIVCSLLMFAFAGPAAAFFQMEKLQPILCVLSLLFVIQASYSTATSLLNRDLRFALISAISVVSYVIGFGIFGVGAAFLGFGIWALVLANLVQQFTRMVATLSCSRHDARLLLDFAVAKELLVFGGGISLFRVCQWVASQADVFAVGRAFGADALGFYSRAQQIVLMPIGLIGDTLHRVLFPTLSKSQNDAKQLQGAYRRGVSVVALVMLPCSAIVFLLAEEIVLIVLGSGWEMAIAPVRVLSLAMAVRPGCMVSAALIHAKGAVYRNVWRQLSFDAVIVVGVYLGSSGNLGSVAAAVAAAWAVNYLLSAQLCLAILDMSWTSFLMAHLRGVGLALAACVTVGPIAALLRCNETASWVTATCSLLCYAAILLPSTLRHPQFFLGRDGMWLVDALYSRFVMRKIVGIPQV